MSVNLCRHCLSDKMERDALIALYKGTDGSYWKTNSNWLTRRPLNEWFGVDTDNDGRVIALRLSENSLMGKIPHEIGNLNRLRILSLSRNSLTGPIPGELGNLADLRVLALQMNFLTGQIPPELGNLSSLRHLNLKGNKLSGRLPVAQGRRQPPSLNASSSMLPHGSRVEPVAVPAGAEQIAVVGPHPDAHRLRGHPSALP